MNVIYYCKNGPCYLCHNNVCDDFTGFSKSYSLAVLAFNKYCHSLVESFCAAIPVIIINPWMKPCVGVHAGSVEAMEIHMDFATFLYLCLCGHSMLNPCPSICITSQAALSIWFS